MDRELTLPMSSEAKARPRNLMVRGTVEEKRARMPQSKVYREALRVKTDGCRLHTITREIPMVTPREPLF